MHYTAMWARPRAQLKQSGSDSTSRLSSARPRARSATAHDTHARESTTNVTHELATQARILLR